jgi:hypothetical protein
VPRKRDWVDREFASMNFSFILSGEGEYYMDGRVWPVIAPCVITQWPGVPVRYGPRETWEEWFLIFDASSLPELQRLGFARRDRPIWYLREDAAVREALDDMARLRTGVQRRGCADRVDRLVEGLLLASLLAEAHPTQDPQDRAIRQVRRKVEQDYRKDHDFAELARQAGFSPATFRRRWARLVGTPPRRYVLELRHRAQLPGPPLLLPPLLPDHRHVGHRVPQSLPHAVRAGPIACTVWGADVASWRVKACQSGWNRYIVWVDFPPASSLGCPPISWETGSFFC